MNWQVCNSASNLTSYLLIAFFLGTMFASLAIKLIGRGK